MENVEIFKNPEFGEVRTLMVNNEPWFVGKDVAEALGYARTADAVAAHVDAEDKGVGKIPTPPRWRAECYNHQRVWPLLPGPFLKAPIGKAVQAAARREPWDGGER